MTSGEASWAEAGAADDGDGETGDEDAAARAVAEGAEAPPR